MQKQQYITHEFRIGNGDCTEERERLAKALANKFKWPCAYMTLRVKIRNYQNYSAVIVEYASDAYTTDEQLEDVEAKFAEHLQRVLNHHAMTNLIQDLLREE